MNVAKIVTSSILLFWLLHRIGVDNILRQLRSADWPWIAVAVLVFAVSNVLGAMQWFLILRSQKVDLSFLHVLSYYHVGLFFNNFLIGYVGGDALRIYDVRRHSGDSTVAVSSVMFDRFVGFFVLTSIAMFVSFFGIQQLTSFKTVYLIGAILLIWASAFIVLFHEKTGLAVGRIFKPLLPNMLRQKVHGIYVAINKFRHHRLMLTEILGISILVQALRIITHYFAALSVGVHANVVYFFMFIPLVALFASLPISFGGIGVREQSGVTLFSTVGLVASKVVTFEFLAYIIGIVATIPGGILFALRRENNVKMSRTIRQASMQNGGASDV